MKLKFLIVFATIFTLFNCNMQTSKNVRVIEASAYKKEITNKKVQLIDVRTSSEFAQGAIANAQNFDVLQSNFDQKIKTLDATKPVYIYCRSGSRSRKAAEILENAGFKQIVDLKGGYLNWK